MSNCSRVLTVYRVPLVVARGDSHPIRRTVVSSGEITRETQLYTRADQSVILLLLLLVIDL